jgi:hypothetical protein
MLERNSCLNGILGPPRNSIAATPEMAYRSACEISGWFFLTSCKRSWTMDNPALSGSLDSFAKRCSRTKQHANKFQGEISSTGIKSSITLQAVGLEKVRNVAVKGGCVRTIVPFAQPPLLSRLSKVPDACHAKRRAIGHAFAFSAQVCISHSLCHVSHHGACKAHHCQTSILLLRLMRARRISDFRASTLTSTRSIPSGSAMLFCFRG